MCDEVYVLWRDNGEPYEDHARYLVGLFEDKNDAIEKVKSSGYTSEDKGCFYRPVRKEHICSLGKYHSLEECMEMLEDSLDPLPCEYCKGEFDYLDDLTDYAYMFYEKYPLHKAKGV